MATVGAKNLYFATVTSDSDSATVYSTPKRIVGLINVDINPTINTNTLHADDAPFYSNTSLSEISITLETADLPLEDVATLLGHTYDSTDGTVTYANSDTAPYVAILFESEKADGGVRFVKLLKGKFADGQENIQTKGENIEYVTNSITGTFVCRQSDGGWKIVSDAATASAAATTRATWFSAV